jgi:hypothetical protein
VPKSDLRDALGFKFHSATRIGFCGQSLQDRLTMSEQDQAEVRLALARVKQDHNDFNAAIDAMIAMGCDPLQIQRMKKKKLTLKDRMTQLEDQVLPDIMA